MYNCYENSDEKSKGHREGERERRVPRSSASPSDDLGVHILLRAARPCAVRGRSEAQDEGVCGLALPEGGPAERVLRSESDLQKGFLLAAFGLAVRAIGSVSCLDLRQRERIEMRNKRRCRSDERKEGERNEKDMREVFLTCLCDGACST